jgi:hypothetical protein
MNGWSNLETWKVWIEMQNIESEHLFWNHQVKTLNGKDALIARLSAFYGEDRGINFEEIADALMEGEQK